MAVDPHKIFQKGKSDLQTTLQQHETYIALIEKAIDQKLEKEALVLAMEGETVRCQVQVDPTKGISALHMAHILSQRFREKRWIVLVTSNCSKALANGKEVANMVFQMPKPEEK